jgi:hypothetical protein
MPAMSRRSWILVLALCFVALVGGGAEAGKKKAKTKYHFELESVKAQPGVQGQVAADVLKALEAEIRKAFATHPRMVADLTGAPDPQTDAKGYAKWLKKKKVSGSYLVNVDLTTYREEQEDSPDGKGKRIVVRLEIHMFGETIPERKMAFEGEGSSTVKQDVGKKVRDKDREFTVQSAIELAVADAMKQSLAKLSEPAKTPKK